MVAIGRAILGRPKLLMLDEPTEGVWIGVIEEIAEQLIRLSSVMSIILVEQHIELAMKVAQTAYIMDRGRVAMQGPVNSVREDPELLKFLAP
jgi:branched-chain amino acid transport system ATP-binding protein